MTEECPDSVVLYKLLGDVHYSLDQYEDAYDAYTMRPGWTRKITRISSVRRLPCISRDAMRTRLSQPPLS